MPKKLTPEQIAGYERDGYVCPVDGFSTERARAWRDRMEAFERAEGQKMTRGHNFKPHLLFPWVDEIVHAPEVLDAVEDLIGPDIRLFHLTVWPKDAGSGAYVSWHQDATYFALEPACHVTAWVALTDAPIEAGCMEVVPGSHKLGQLPHAELQDTENLLSRGQTLAVDVDRQRTAFMPVKAGQFSLHHTHLVHNSRPNHYHDRRIGLGISYIPTSARCTAQESRHRHAGARQGRIRQLRRRAAAGRGGGSRRARVPRRGRGALPGDECRGIAGEQDRRG